MIVFFVRIFLFPDDMYELRDEVDVLANTGIEYAKVTGDWNPHHLFKWSAWLLGYKQPIAHGMWTLAKAVDQVQRSKSYNHGRIIKFIRVYYK